MENAYGEKPMVPYRATTVDMSDVIDYLQVQDMPVEVKRATYIIFRNESANGHAGVNNNYVGAQADGRRWDAKWDDYIVGIVEEWENNGGDRLFLAFDSWETSVDFLADRVEERGLYVGGTTHLVVHMTVADEKDLAIAYEREWVTGNAEAKVPLAVFSSIASMYRQAREDFV
jgi:hypothetical protein